MKHEKVAVVVGAGPGLGAAAARRFAREGYAVALVSRSRESSAEAKAAIEAQGGVARAVAADAGDPAAVAAAFAEIRGELGSVGVLVYNAGWFRVAEFTEVTPEEMEQAWRALCFGGFLCAREVAPAMVERGEGTMIFTGATASMRGAARFSALAVGKFGLRALAQSLARELGPRGVHVAHVVVDGLIDTARVRGMMPGRAAETMLSPDAIAETYWQLHAQDRTAWTQELDIRPAGERF